MAEEKKPFVCYKSGWNIRISPQTSAGWIALGWWMAAMAMLTGGFLWLMSGGAQGPKLTAYVVLYVFAMTLWTIALARWTYLRSEVVNMNELIALKRELDLKKQRGRR